MTNLLEKYNSRYEERCDKKDELGAMYLKGHTCAIEDVSVEIAALIEEADSDLEMSCLAHAKDRDKIGIDKNGHGAYVKALKDLAGRLGVKLEGE